MLDHIAIATKDPQNLIETFKKLGFEYKKMEVVEKEEVKIHFLIKDKLKIEILQPLNEKSKILNFINKKGETFHHIALSVENINEEMEKLKKRGFNFIEDNPKTGAGGKKIAFIHPKTSFGILIEIVEEKNESE